MILVSGFGWVYVTSTRFIDVWGFNLICRFKLGITVFFSSYEGVQCASSLDPI